MSQAHAGLSRALRMGVTLILTLLISTAVASGDDNMQTAPPDSPEVRTRSSSIPEPGIVALVGTGLIGTIGIIRRQQMA